MILGLSLLSLAVIPDALVPGCKWESHDLIFNMERFAAASRAMADGQWFPRWSRDINSGYGYPLLLFYPPLTPWFVATLNLAGLGILNGTKLLVALSSILAAVTTWRLGRYLWHDRLSAALASACYVLLPYHLLTLMVRGALAEYAAHALLPALLLTYLKLPGGKPAHPGDARQDGAMDAANSTEYARSIASAAVLSALLMLTHNASWMLLIPLCLLLTPLGGPACLKRFISAVAATALSLGLSAFYWLPAFVEKSFVAIGNLGSAGHLDYHNHFTSFEKIFSEKWGYDGIGTPLTILWVFAVIALLTPRAQNFPHRAIIIALAAAVPVVIMLTFPLAAPLWDRIVLIQYIQFPWRLTAVAGLCAAAAAPAALRLLPGRMSRSFAAVTVVVALAALTPLQADRPIQRFDDRPGLSQRHLRTSGTTTVVGDEYRPLTAVEPAATLYGPRAETVTGEDPCSVIIPVEDRSHLIEAFIVSDTPSRVRVNCLYFPGWTATVDSRPAAIRPDARTGLMEIELPVGDRRLELRFGNTPVRNAGIVLSTLSFLFLLAMVTAGTPLNPFRKSR